MKNTNIISKGDLKMKEYLAKLCKKKTITILVAVIYFGLLAYTMLINIYQYGVTKGIIYLGCITTGLALGSYVMLFSSTKEKDIQEPENEKVEKFLKSRHHSRSEKVIGIISLILGVFFMILNL